MLGRGFFYFRRLMLGGGFFYFIKDSLLNILQESEVLREKDNAALIQHCI